MNKTLTDIREQLSKNTYYNVGQVRSALVNRILQDLGWDIWQPREVYPDYRVSPTGSEIVDLALFAKGFRASVFISIKSPDGMVENLVKFEGQLREYNRANPATFSILTDGKNWRFYLSNKGGEFSDKCYKIINIQDDDIGELEKVFSSLLSKQEILAGNSLKEADVCLVAALEAKQKAAQIAAAEKEAAEKEAAEKKAAQA